MARKPKNQNVEASAPKADKDTYGEFAEFKVKPIYEKQRGEDGSNNNVCVGFEKERDKPERTTRITQRIADELNSQSENTGVRLYPVDAEQSTEEPSDE
jgi:hypothetical protein